MSRRKRTILWTDRVRLEVFLRCVRDLEETGLVREGFTQLRFSIKIDSANRSILFRDNAEDDKDKLRSFLTAFRKFVSNDEPANIERTLNTCYRIAGEYDSEVLNSIKELKDAWKHAYRIGHIQMETSGSEGRMKLTPKHVLDLWMYGAGYIHNWNRHEEEIFNELIAQELPSVKAQLLFSLPILTGIIISAAEPVNTICASTTIDTPT